MFLKSSLVVGKLHRPAMKKLSAKWVVFFIDFWMLIFGKIIKKSHHVQFHPKLQFILTNIVYFGPKYTNFLKINCDLWWNCAWWNFFTIFPEISIQKSIKNTTHFTDNLFIADLCNQVNSNHEISNIDAQMNLISASEFDSYKPM